MECGILQSQANAHLSCVKCAQILPFILRRTKEQVLKDLPPKILQDVYVEPSPLQRRLYEDFAHSPASQEIAVTATGKAGARDGEKAPHVFQVRPPRGGNHPCRANNDCILCSERPPAQYCT